jgi:putative ABC transport system ATP-binding protein
MSAPRPGSAPVNDIVLNDVIVDYSTAAETVRALDCPHLAVSSGTSLAVMGPSGCGKSTLLGLLAGLAVPTSGSVRIGSHTISTLPERGRVAFRRRSLGMVYQADNLLSHLTVEENIGLQLSICGATAGDRAKAEDGTEVVLARLGLASLARRFPDQLSGGQRQRVAVARAIIHRPTVLLADEPTGALDDASARIVIELLLEVQREMGATLVLVTHDPQIATRLDRVVHLSGRSSASLAGATSHVD